MKTFSEWSELLFLKKWDNYLLTHYPVVWRTKALFVLFYGLIGAIVLFAAGYLYPIDAQHLTVDPIRPIDISTDPYYLFVLLFLSFGLLYWAYRQYQLGFPFTKMKDALLTLGLYGICFWVVLGFTVPAFRMGTIVRTANWIDQEDLDTLEKSGIYPYGFVFLEGDNVYDKTPTHATFFQPREFALKSVFNIENFFLQNRYTTDSVFWINSFLNYHIDTSDYLYKTYNKRNQSNMLYVPKLSYIQWLLDISNTRSLMSMSYQSYALNESPNTDIADGHIWLYVLYRSYPLDRYFQTDKPTALALLNYNQQKEAPKLSNEFNQYKFTDSIELVKFSLPNRLKDSLSYIRPILPYSVEKSVRSVVHARLYLKEGMYWKHLFRLSLFIPFFVFFLFSSTYLSFKNAFISALILATGFILVVNYGFGKYNELTNNEAIYLALPFAGLIMLFISFFKKRYYKFELFAVNIISLSIALSLSVILANELFSKNEVESYPSNISFFGMQIIGLLSMLLITYANTLPKVR